jgi:hydroxymethylbilane synthase
VIATSSLRRRAQLLAARPDLQVADLRGNVDTRLAKLDRHLEWAAIVLAAAGLMRLGLGHRIGERLAPEVMLPAPGQGALAVTVRVDDTDLLEVIRQAAHHKTTALQVAAERAFLRRLEGGCQVPVAAYAQPSSGGQSLQLQGRVISLGGESIVEGTELGLVHDESEADALGTALAQRLLAEGAAGILAEVRTSAAPVVTEP